MIYYQPFKNIYLGILKIYIQDILTLSLAMRPKMVCKYKKVTLHITKVVNFRQNNSKKHNTISCLDDALTSPLKYGFCKKLLQYK